MVEAVYVCGEPFRYCDLVTNCSRPVVWQILYDLAATYVYTLAYRLLIFFFKTCLLTKACHECIGQAADSAVYKDGWVVSKKEKKFCEISLSRLQVWLHAEMQQFGWAYL